MEAETPITNEETPAETLASRLIDAWCADKGRKIPWAKAIQIVAIVTKQPDAERDRLLRLGDEDGSCEMCGRNAITLESDLTQLRAELEQAESRLREAQADAERLRGGLKWYADGNHYELSEWDEEEGWLCPPSDDSWMVEPGHVARAILSGASINPDSDADEITLPPAARAAEGGEECQTVSE